MDCSRKRKTASSAFPHARSSRPTCRISPRGAAEGDTTLVAAETAIAALSYAALKLNAAERYVSTAGELNPAQPRLLQSVFEQLPEGGRVILAMDAYMSELETVQAWDVAETTNTPANIIEPDTS